MAEFLYRRPKLEVEIRLILFAGFTMSVTPDAWPLAALSQAAV